MKKILNLLLAVLLSFYLISCDKKDQFVIEDIEVIYQESKEVIVSNDKGIDLKLDYTFQGDAIRFEDNIVYGLVFDTETLVTAKSGKISTTFTVKVILSPKDDYFSYKSYIINDDEVGILEYIGIKITGQLKIPTYIAGKKVVAIADEAFANNQEKLSDVTSIIIPKYIKKIGEKAFYNNNKITSITFDENSELFDIGPLAFSKISNLEKFTIPSNVHYIGELAFKDSGIVDFNIINNPNYEWKDNFLIDKNVSDTSSFIAIYANPTISDFIVPEHVKILGGFLFENNKNIKSIDLNKVKFIGYRAFANSSLEVLIGGESVEIDSTDVFLNTPWLNNQK